MSVNEETIRKLARQIWEDEGKPDGQSERHWKLATDIAQRDENNTHQGKRSIDPSEATGPTEPEQPDQT